MPRAETNSPIKLIILAFTKEPAILFNTLGKSTAMAPFIVADQPMMVMITLQVPSQILWEKTTRSYFTL